MKCPSCGTKDLIEIPFEVEGKVVAKKYRCPACSRFTTPLPPESTVQDGYNAIKEARQKGDALCISLRILATVRG